MEVLFSNFRQIKAIATLAIAMFAGQASMAMEKAHIIVNTANTDEPSEFVITAKGQDSATSTLRTTSEPGCYEFTIETDNIELYEIYDWTQITTNGFTSRTASFLIEDGAEITLTLDGNVILVQSTGKEQQTKQKMDIIAKEKFEAKQQEIKKIEDKTLKYRLYDQLITEEDEWALQYYINNPMISFLLELDVFLSNPRFENHTLWKKLQMYHEHYSDKYPDHPAHQRIADSESRGFQIFGDKYHDYDVRTLDGEKVRGYDFLKPGYNLVVLWATWCAPCRRECQEIAKFINPYMEAGLNVFALTREFENTDKVKEVVEKDKYPWPTLVDLDNEFQVFDLHGATSSAAFLINPEGEIVFTGLGPEEVKEALDKYITPIN